MSTLEARGPSLRRYRQRKAVLDLNVPPSEIREHEGTSQQAGSEELIDRPAPPATIDVETIDDDVIESSAIAFAEAKTNSRRSRGRTVVDVDSGIQIAERNCNSGRYFTVAPPSKTDIREKHGWPARSTNNNQNRCRGFLSSPTVIDCDHYINLESSPRSMVEEITRPQPSPKEPTFNCPICMCSLNEEMSTRCGHIFCKACIKAAIAARPKYPT